MVSLLAVVLVGSNVRWATKSFPPSENPGQQLVMSAVGSVAALILCWWLIRCTYVSSWKRSETGVPPVKSPNPRFQRDGAIAPPLNRRVVDRMKSAERWT